MQELSKIKLWRAEEFVKLFLLKYEGDFTIEETTSRGNLFDIYLHFKGMPKYRFAIEVKHTDKFNQKLNYQLKQLVKLRNENQIDIPVILFRVNDEMEYGEIDFLIVPSIKEKRLLVRETFKFVKMDNLNFKEKLETIKKWYKIK